MGYYLNSFLIIHSSDILKRKLIKRTFDILYKELEKSREERSFTSFKPAFIKATSAKNAEINADDALLVCEMIGSIYFSNDYKGSFGGNAFAETVMNQMIGKRLPSGYLQFFTEFKNFDGEDFRHVVDAFALLDPGATTRAYVIDEMGSTWFFRRVGDSTEVRTSEVSYEDGDEDEDKPLAWDDPDTYEWWREGLHEKMLPQR